MTADAVSGGLLFSCVPLGGLIMSFCRVRLVALVTCGTNVSSMTAAAVIVGMMFLCATIGGLLVLFC